MKQRIPTIDSFINESSDSEKYCDFGCQYIKRFLEKNPKFDTPEFIEYVVAHNKADRDEGELQDISKDEILRLAKAYMKADINERAEKEGKVTLNVTIGNLDKETAQDFLKMFRFMEWCGSVGTARSFEGFFDGDGHFRPNISVDGIDLDKVLDLDDFEDDTLKLGFGA